METIVPMQTVQTLQTNAVLRLDNRLNNTSNIKPISFVPTGTRDTSSNHKRSPFIEANTIAVTLENIRSDFIPVFAKDNESTISHP